MPRTLFALALVAVVAAPLGADESAKPSPEPLTLRHTLRRGQRFSGSNSVSFTLKTRVRQGDREESSSQSVERTERFVDKVLRSGTHGMLEIERTYMKLFTKARTGDDDRPEVFQSPLQGQTVLLKERKRRRELKPENRSLAIDAMVRRTVGMELDWRDIFPEDPVKPGDEWDGDATALAKRLGAYLNCGTRTKMRVRFEEILVQEGRKIAKLYVDWSIEGMRDRNLFTKADVAGDVYLDVELERVTGVDLVGNLVVRGAIIGKSGQPRIVSGTGQVLVKSSLTALETVEVEASAGSDDEEE